MKSERRHELQTNALADWLGETIERIRPYQTTLLGVALLTLLLIGAAPGGPDIRLAKPRDAWGRLNTALQSGNPALLDDVIEHNRGTSDHPAWPGPWRATFIPHDMGTQERFANQANANKELAKAADYYKLVLGCPRLLAAEGTCHLWLGPYLGNPGQFAGRTAKYEEIEKTWPNGTYAAVVTRRLEDLRSPAIKKFYDDFRNYDPKPVSINEPGLPTKSGLSRPDSLSEPAEEPGFHDPRFNLGGGTNDAKDRAGACPAVG